MAGCGWRLAWHDSRGGGERIIFGAYYEYKLRFVVPGVGLMTTSGVTAFLGIGVSSWYNVDLCLLTTGYVHVQDKLLQIYRRKTRSKSTL